MISLNKMTRSNQKFKITKSIIIAAKIITLKLLGKIKKAHMCAVKHVELSLHCDNLSICKNI